MKVKEIGKLKLTIQDRDDLSMLWLVLDNGGVTPDLDVNEFPDEAFPLSIELDVIGLRGLLKNPMLKPFKKKITETLNNTVIKQIKEAAC